MAEKGTMRLSEFVEQVHGLPLSSRSPEEVDEDYENEISFTRSLGRSLVRRHPKRYESKFVINYLDALADRQEAAEQKIVPITVMQMQATSVFRSLG